MSNFLTIKTFRHRKNKIPKVASSGGIVVDHSPHHSKVKGLSPAISTCTGLEKWDYFSNI
jgi:hypothetical protein